MLRPGCVCVVYIYTYMYVRSVRLDAFGIDSYVIMVSCVCEDMAVQEVWSTSVLEGQAAALPRKAVRLVYSSCKILQTRRHSFMSLLFIQSGGTADCVWYWYLERSRSKRDSKFFDLPVHYINIAGCRWTARFVPVCDQKWLELSEWLLHWKQVILNGIGR